MSGGFCGSRCDDSSVGHRKRLARHYADGLRAASARKHEEAELKVEHAIRELLRAGETLTFSRVATVARVSTGWLYAQADVKERIMRLRGQPAEKPGRPAERASDASRYAIVRALRQRVTTLDIERQQLLARIDQLQQRIEVLYGELYAKHVAAPHAMADPTSSTGENRC